VFLARENIGGAGFALERRILQSKNIVIFVSAVSVDEIWSNVNKGCVNLGPGALSHHIHLSCNLSCPRAREHYPCAALGTVLATLGEASVPREFGRQTGGWPGD
jgi:hypothetical protein